VGNDKFVAVPVDNLDTFGALDALDGGDGKDTFTYSSGAVGGLTIAAGSTVKNIETATLASTTAITADTRTWTGLTQLNLIAGTTTAVTAAATTDVTEAASVNTSSIIGGNNVTVNHSGSVNAVSVDQAAGAVNITNTFLASPTNVTQSLLAKGGAVTVTAKGNVTLTGGTSMDVTVNDGTAYATRVANIKEQTAAKALSTTATLQAATQLTITGVAAMATDIVAGSTVAATNVATTTAMNGGFITLAQKLAIDTAYITAFQAVGGTEALAEAAALAVYAPITAAAQSAHVAAGITGAANAARLSTANLAADTTDASTTRTVTNLTNTGLASAKVTGNFGGTTTITDTKSVLTTVTLDSAGAGTLSGDALANVSISNVVGANGNIVIANNAVGHTQNLTVSNVGTKTTTSGVASFVNTTVTDNAAATINLVSNGTTNALQLLGLGTVTALNITGAGELSLGTTTAANNTALSGTAVINATGSSGANLYTVSVGQSYLGGSGVDTVTTSGVQAVAAPVSGGAGTADKLIVKANADIGVNANGSGSAQFTGFEILELTASGTTVDLSTQLLGNTLSNIILKPTAGHQSTISVTGVNAATQTVTISTAASATPYVVGVTGATSVGQIDALTVSAGAALGALNIAGVETLNITPTSTTSFNLGNAGALGAINITGGSSAVLISGEGVTLNPNTVIDASKGTGKAMLNMSGATGGTKLVGSATANNLLTSSAASSVLVGGAGNDILRGGAGDDTISAGNGNNTVETGNGINTVTLGNGMNKVISGTGVDTTTVGTGTNWITAGAGLDVITLGAHALGNVHTIDLAGAGTGSSDVLNVVTVNGFNSGVDKINLSGAVGGTFGGLTLTGATTQATMLAPVTDVTSVADLTAVYAALVAALDNSAGHEFAASGAGAAGLVARNVIYTTGAAAGTYLVINDSVAAFNGTNDIVMKLTGKTTVAAGDILAAGTAFSVTPSQAFTGTVGNDRFTGGDLADTFSFKFSDAINQSTLNTGPNEVLNGGNGVDTLTIGAARSTSTNLTLADADFANMVSIENLVITNSATTDGAASLISVTGAGNYMTAGFNSVTTTTKSGANSVLLSTGVVPQTITATTTSGAIVITSAGGADTITAKVGIAAVAAVPATNGNSLVAAVDAVPGAGTISITGGAGADAITLTSLGGARTGAATINVSSVVGTSSDSGRVAVANNDNDTGEDTITGFDFSRDFIKVTATAVNNYVHSTDGVKGTATGGVNDGSIGSFLASAFILNLDKTAGVLGADVGDIVLSFASATSDGTTVAVPTAAQLNARIQYNLTGTAAADTITGGALDDIIDGGNGGDTINVGAGTDTVVITGASGSGTIVFADVLTDGTLATGDTWTVTGVDVITGIGTGDTINLPGTLTLAALNGTTGLATATNYGFVRGDFAVGVFTFAAGGADGLIVYHDGVAGADAIVLVGVTALTGITVG